MGAVLVVVRRSVPDLAVWRPVLQETRAAAQGSPRQAEEAATARVRVFFSRSS